MKIFVSSTVKDLVDLRDELYRRLKDLGHTPLFSERNDFPTNRHPDAMTNCLKVVEDCELFVVLLDKRAGLPYENREGSSYQDLFGLTISEAEYRCAKQKGKPICIFIRKKTEYESAIFRQIKDEEKRKSMKWYSDTAVYDFYDRLLHEKPHVPWRYTFDTIEEIMQPLIKTINDFQPNLSSILTQHESLQEKSIQKIIYYPPDPIDVSDFVNRESEQKNLEELIRRKKHMIIIQGIAGMGKTQIAAKLMENLKDFYLIQWKEMRDIDTFDSITRNLAGFLRTDNNYELADYIENGGTDHEIIINILINNLKLKQYILIFDNFQVVANKEIHDLFRQFRDKLTLTLSDLFLLILIFFVFGKYLYY